MESFSPTTCTPERYVYTLLPVLIGPLLVPNRSILVELTELLGLAWLHRDCQTLMDK